MKTLFGLLLIVPLICVTGSCISTNVQFDRAVEGRLKRAADADSVELAYEELSAAIAHAEDRHLTSGSTHILWATPSHDIKFWYTNLKAAQHNLKALPKGADPLTVSNQLMRLRSTLLDQKGEEQPTLPPNIAFYPNQVSITVIWWISLGIAGIGVIMIMVEWAE